MLFALGHAPRQTWTANEKISFATCLKSRATLIAKSLYQCVSLGILDGTIPYSYDVASRGEQRMKSTPSIGPLLGALLWMVTVSAAVFAQNSGIQADIDVAGVESVKQLELELCSLIVKSDWAAYSRHLTDDYVRIIAGQVESKEEVLRKFRTAKPKTISMTPEKIDVRIYGDAAVLVIDLRTRERRLMEQ
jgi:hypothetical protein